MLNILSGILLYFICELFSYVWHRFGSHDDLIPGLHDFHRSHHQNKEEDHDFLFVLFLVILMEILFVFLINLNVISVFNSVMIIVIVLLIFVYNWLLHLSYHNENSFLNYFEFFKLERERHQMHHTNPKINYGITCHLFDKLFGTWVESPYYKNEIY